ncbi:putative alpha,alpha-trehalose-phosphate synthase [Sesbania bispinosa]|nr:putative alpha,alpha-trehalose-phosphate synthase [Sesbania bispinosa]
MPGNKYNDDSNNHIPNRVERLLRDRELRKNTRAILNESSDNSICNNSNNEGLEQEQRLKVEEKLGEVEGVGGGRVGEGCERGDGKPVRQRSKCNSSMETSKQQ